MESFVQAMLVALLVIASAVFAAWRLMPARTKLRVLDAVKPTAGNAMGRWLLRRREGVLAELAGGCGSCSQASTHTASPRPGVAMRQGRQQKPRFLP